MINKILSFFSNNARRIALVYAPAEIKSRGLVYKIGLALATSVVIVIGLMFWWSETPEPASVDDVLTEYVGQPMDESQIRTGAALTAMNAHIIDVLINKRGGYIRNDVTAPGLIMDNVPEWEYGVLRNLRDLSKVFRNRFATSGSQTKLDEDLSEVENKLSIDSEQWMFPQPENAYDDASKALRRYLDRIMDPASDAQFYARADNLASYFNVVSPNLGSYSQRLSESVGKVSEDMALVGDASATQSTEAASQLFTKTPWHKVDNVFYEARGYTWALLQEVQAIKVDFRTVLEKKNAMAYIDQLVRELEATQSTIWSPVILNGSGFGLVTNHSLVMASYLSRANAIIIELSALLERG